MATREPVAGHQPREAPTGALDVEIAANLSAVRGRIERAARAAGRNPGDIQLVAVSKTFGMEYIRAAATAGQIDFGENRVQEALQKIGVSTDLQIRWHLVGHLQSNKARKAPRFDWIHSVDSIELLRKLDQAAGEQQAAPNLLVQVDLAHEAAKHGAPVAELPHLLEAAAACRAVQVCGLMVLPPWSADPEGARPYFSRLRALREELLAAGSEPSMLRHLSMGMSHDLEVAVQEGSTIVRVGTALFGTRQRVASRA